MRIGLLTYFWEDNPGEFFQALATLQALRRVFPEAEVEMPDVRHWDQTGSGLSRRYWLTCPWRNLSLRQRRRRYTEARNCDLSITGPKVVTHDPVVAVREIETRAYDLLVVGSDTTLYLWGDERVQEDLPPLYWLADLPKTPRVMLSSCSHNSRYEKLNPTQREIMTRALKAFSFLAVRDPLTARLLESLGPPNGVPVRISPDPTFSYTVDPAPAQAAMARRRLGRKKPVCGLTVPYFTPFTKELARLLRGYFEITDLTGHYKGCTPVLEIGPYEWSGIFSQFDLHVTTSFHESIFCLKQGTPVFTVEAVPFRFDTQSGKSKAYFLHEEFGLLDRHYFNPHVNQQTPEEVCRRILERWESFDSQAAVKHAQELGQRYMDIVMQMRRTVAGPLGLRD